MPLCGNNPEMENLSFQILAVNRLRKPENSVRLVESSAESSHLTRYRLLQLQFKFQ